MASQTFTADGTFTWPSGITQVTVECWGAGGGGNYNANAGGGGGGYARSIVVKIGPTDPAVVGVGGTGAFDPFTNNDTDGTNSYFRDGSTVQGNGGHKGSGDRAGGSGTGTAVNTAGNGGLSDSVNGGGGGGAGGTANPGTSGLDTGTPGVGGSLGGGDGGTGGGATVNGSDGVFPGGGGGGGGIGSVSAGNGANGKVIVSWVDTNGEQLDWFNEQPAHPHPKQKSIASVVSMQFSAKWDQTPAELGREVHMTQHPARPPLRSLPTSSHQTFCDPTFLDNYNEQIALDKWFEQPPTKPIPKWTLSYAPTTAYTITEEQLYVFAFEHTQHPRRPIPKWTRAYAPIFAFLLEEALIPPPPPLASVADWQENIEQPYSRKPPYRRPSHFQPHTEPLIPILRTVADVSTWFNEQPTRPIPLWTRAYAPTFMVDWDEEQVHPKVPIYPIIVQPYPYNPPKKRNPFFLPKEEPLEPSLRLVPSMVSWFNEPPTPNKLTTGKKPRTPQLYNDHTKPLEPSLFVITLVSTWFEEPPTRPPLRRLPPASQPSSFSPYTEPSLFVIPTMTTWFEEPPSKPPSRPRSTDFPFFTTSRVPSTFLFPDLPTWYAQPATFPIPKKRPQLQTSDNNVFAFPPDVTVYYVHQTYDDHQLRRARATADIQAHSNSPATSLYPNPPEHPWSTQSPTCPPSLCRPTALDTFEQHLGDTLYAIPQYASQLTQSANPPSFLQKRSLKPWTLGYFVVWTDPNQTVIIGEEKITGTLSITQSLGGELRMRYFLAIDSDNDIEWHDAEFSSDGENLTNINGVTATALIRDSDNVIVGNSQVTAAYDSVVGCWRATFPYTCILTAGATYYPELTMIATLDSDGVTSRPARGKKRLTLTAQYAE